MTEGDASKTDVSAAITGAASRLRAAGIAEPRREARSLLAFVLGRDESFLIAHPEYALTRDEHSDFEVVVGRRASREPFQLIIGKQEFFGLDFICEEGVLIPRPETELLVERAIELLSKTNDPRFVEIGVGTGCISVSVLHSVRTASAMGIDISPPALDLAEKNARKHAVSGRLLLRRADLFAGLEGEYDLVVSNPPYVPEADLATLQPEVARFDPPEALFGGDDGLDAIRRLVEGAPRFLKPGGHLLMEIGFGQAERVEELFSSEQWSDTHFLYDLQGIPRVVDATSIKGQPS